MAVDAEWHHSRSSDLSSTPQLSEYGVIGCASTEAPSNNCPTIDHWPLTIGSIIWCSESWLAFPAPFGHLWEPGGNLDFWGIHRRNNRIKIFFIVSRSYPLNQFGFVGSLTLQVVSECPLCPRLVLQNNVELSNNILVISYLYLCYIYTTHTSDCHWSFWIHTRSKKATCLNSSTPWKHQFDILWINCYALYND